MKEIAGKKETLSAEEMVITRNIQAVVAHGNESRGMIRTFETRIDQLEKEGRQQREEIQNLKQTIALMQSKIYELERT